MPTDTSNNIKIHFRAEGEEELINAIQALSRATNTLKNSQMALAKSMGQTEKQREKAAQSGLFAIRNQRNMNDAVSQGSMTFSVFRSKLLLASFAVGLVGNSVGRLVRAFAEQEDSEKRIEAVLESTGNIAGVTSAEIRDMTARLEDVGVVGDEVNNKVASLLLTFTNIRGEAFERTMIAANNMAISISGGIPTFEQLKSSALQLGKALQDPAAQLGALSRSGFTFSGTQKEMIKNLIEQNKLLEAQSIILDAAETQFGGLNEKMQDTATGSFAALQNASGSLSETIGKILTPATSEFVKSLTELFKSLSKSEASIRATLDTVKVVAGAYGIYRTATFAAAVTTTQLTNAFLMLRAVINPVTAVLSFLGITYFQIKKRQHELKLSTESSTEAIVKQAKIMDEDIDAYDNMKKSLDERVIAAKNSAEIDAINAKIKRQATTETKLQALEEKKAILVKQELNKIDEKYREVARDAVKEIVEGTIAKERDVILTQRQEEALKKLNEEQAKRQVIISSTGEALRLYGVTEAKIARFSSINTKKQFDEESKRIEQLIAFDGHLRAMGISSFELSEAIESGQKISQLSFTNTDAAVQKALASIGLLVDAEGRLVDVTKRFGEVSVSAFDEFMEKSQIATQALSGFSQAQTQLVEERMRREMEALKASRDYESATQEEREIMENRVEQRFKSARRRAFQIQKASNIAEATMNVAQAYTKALATLPPPGNIPLATFIAALGAAQVAAIAAQPAPRFATGGSFITSGPQNILVGESGAEKVTIQPLSGQSANQSSSNKQNIYINISAPLVDETIVDVIIPKIREAAKLNLA